MDLSGYARIAIAGGPRTGKTTRAKDFPDHPVLHTDDSRLLRWEDRPAAILAQLAELDRWVVEGVLVPRLLRKGLDPDVVVWLATPKLPLTARQVAMTKGIHTTMESWTPTCLLVREN